MSDVLTKPLDLEQLVATLRLWVPARPHAAGGSAGRPARSGGARHPPAAFPEIPGIDRARAAAALAGNRALFIELLRRFAGESAGVAAAARAALAAGDAAAAGRLMHTLKGNAGTLGALDLMAAADGLEAAIARGEAGVQARLEALAAGIDALLAASAPWRAGTTDLPDADPGAASRIDAGALGRLREALRGRDLAAVDAFAALRPGLQGARGDAWCEALGAAIGDLDFSRALALLEQVDVGGS